MHTRGAEKWYKLKIREKIHEKPELVSSCGTMGGGIERAVVKNPRSVLITTFLHISIMEKRAHVGLRK